MFHGCPHNISQTKVDHPDRWLECEKAIKKRLGEIDEVDVREEAAKELIKDGMEVGWTETVRKAIWSCKMLQDTKDMTQR